MAIINLTRMGLPTADHEAEKKALSLVRTLDRLQEYKTSSQCLWRAFQTLLAEGKIKPEDVAFKYEGETLLHDKYGRIQSPAGYTDPLIQLETRFQLAVRRAAGQGLTNEQKTKLTEIFREWFKCNMVEVFTKGTQFYICTEHVTEEFIDEDVRKHSPKMTVIAHPKPPETTDGQEIVPEDLVWATDQQQQPYLITERGMLLWSDVQMAAFDLNGDKIIPKPYNQRKAFELVGADPSLFSPNWYSTQTLTPRG